MGIYDPNHLFERISILYIDDSHIHHHANYSLNSMIHVYSPRNDHDDPLIAMIFYQAAPKETTGASVGHSYPGCGGRH